MAWQLLLWGSLLHNCTLNAAAVERRGARRPLCGTWFLTARTCLLTARPAHLPTLPAAAAAL